MKVQVWMKVLHAFFPSYMMPRSDSHMDTQRNRQAILAHSEDRKRAAAEGNQYPVDSEEATITQPYILKHISKEGDFL